MKGNMYTVQSNLRQLIRQLEAQKGRDYEVGHVAQMARLSRVTVSKLVNNNTSRIDFDTLAKLLTFFRSEGMAITISDLFVERTVTAPPP